MGLPFIVYVENSASFASSTMSRNFYRPSIWKLSLDKLHVASTSLLRLIKRLEY